MNSQDVWIVIPAFNEATVIGDVVDNLRSRYENIVVVDDGSSDNTQEVAASAGAHVVRHILNLGQGAGLQTGIEYALRMKAAYVVTFDADGQHNPDNIDTMLEVLVAEKVDVVLGSRFLGRTVEMPFVRGLVLKLATVFTNFTSGLELTDTHNGLRVMTASAARGLDLQQNRMAHASEVLNKISDLKLSYREVPVEIIYTEYSMAKGQKLSNSFRILAELFAGWLAK